MDSTVEYLYPAHDLADHEIDLLPLPPCYGRLQFPKIALQPVDGVDHRPGEPLSQQSYQAGFDPERWWIVVLNEEFPRSVIYSVDRRQRNFGKLKGDRNKEAWKQIDFMIGKIMSR